jgi:hypothetical protein
LSYIALGLNFSAIWSGQGNFLLPREIALHAARTGVAGANRLITKLTTAGHARIEGK